MIMFIDRKEELKDLLEIANTNKSALVLVYGRRRIGKSRLLTEFAKKVNALYFLADISENILDILSKQASQEFVKFNVWDDFFEFILKSDKKVIIIDEFQYLYVVNKAWPSILQRWWEKIKETDKKIILCGSIISTIYKIAMGYGSALYGRKTHEFEIKPLKFKFLKECFPNYSCEELVEVYSVLGGIPRYIEEFDSKLSVEENIKKKILNKISFLYNEPINLLFEEFRNPASYISIILAITQGYARFSDISKTSNIQSHKLPKYLLVLERAGIIEKEIPVTEKKIRAKTTRYTIKDNFYKFWFKFVFKNKILIEQELEKQVFDLIKKEFNAYVGRSFEEICKETIIHINMCNFSKIGKWWHKDREIDIVALNENTKEIFFFECKWQNNVNAEKILADLKEKAKFVEWNTNKRKEHYFIFAKSFEKKTKNCYDLKDIEKETKRLV